jgi:hypothetical protein
LTRIYLDPVTNQLVLCVPFERKTRQGRVELRTAGKGQPAVQWDPQRKLVLALARAQLWQDQLDSGKYKSVGELSAKLGFQDSSYVSRTLNLALLDWQIKELILDGKEPSGMSLSKLAHGIPLDWDEQRIMFGLPPRLSKREPQELGQDIRTSTRGTAVQDEPKVETAACVLEPVSGKVSEVADLRHSVPRQRAKPSASHRPVAPSLFDDLAG